MSAGHTPGPIWACKIGTRSDVTIPHGADAPMRQAVEETFRKLTGIAAEFTFSGWSATLEEIELAVVENRLPSEDHHKQWCLREAAPDLLEACEDALDGLLHLEEGALGYAGGPMDADGLGYLYPVKDELITRLTAAIAKARGDAS